jgi:cystathionine gamma-synthase/cystathionine gamma-lyase/cystathionine beta-lyase
VHAGERQPGPEGSVVYSIYQGTVYTVPPGTDYHDIRYIRLNSTPSQEYLHDKLAELEGGEAAVATASGMAAITTTLLSLLGAGDHLIALNTLYGGTLDFITQDAADLGWTYSLVDAQRAETWSAACNERTRVFLAETITNPLMRVPRLAVPEAQAIEIVHEVVAAMCQRLMRLSGPRPAVRSGHRAAGPGRTRTADRG